MVGAASRAAPEAAFVGRISNPSWGEVDGLEIRPTGPSVSSWSVPPRAVKRGRRNLAPAPGFPFPRWAGGAAADERTVVFGRPPLPLHALRPLLHRRARLCVGQRRRAR